MDGERDRRQERVPAGELTGIARPGSASKVNLQHIVPGTKVSLRPFKALEWKERRGELMQLERSAYPGGVQFDEETKMALFTGEKSIAVVAENEEGKIIGESCGNLLDEERDELEEGAREADAFRFVFDRYGSRKTLYVDGFGVLPEYRGQGIGTELTRMQLVEAKKAGYDFAIAHVNEEKALGIYMKFGTGVIASYPNWYGTEETHALLELELRDMRSKLRFPEAKQKTESTCGPASISAVLSYFGKSVSEEVLAKKAKTDDRQGTSPAGMLSAATDPAYGMHARVIEHASIDDIEGYIDAGFPVIALFFLRSENDDHYSVITGYDKDNIFMMDVYAGKEQVMSKNAFASDWFCNTFGLDRWMMVMFPKDSIKDELRK